MKKLISVLLVMLALTFTVSAATDVALSFGASSNYLELGLTSKDNNTSFSGQIGLQAEADFTFSRGSGFYVNLGYVQSTIEVGGGYAYTTRVGSFDMYFTVGPHFYIQNTSAEFGLDTKCMFVNYFSGRSGFFVSFGAGLEMDFIKFGGGQQTEGYFDMSLLIPEFAIGYKF